MGAFAAALAPALCDASHAMALAISLTLLYLLGAALGAFTIGAGLRFDRSPKAGIPNDDGAFWIQQKNKNYHTTFYYLLVRATSIT